jgi:hypothetical protein
MLDLSQVPIEVLSGNTKGGVESAASLRIKRIPIEKVWVRRKASYGSSELDFFKKTILFAKHIWNQGDTTDLVPVIDYSEVEEPMDVLERRDTEMYEMRIGLTNPAQILLNRDPDLGDEDDAKEVIQNNLNITKELLGTGVKNPNEDVDNFLQRVQEVRRAKNGVVDDLKGEE